VADRCERQVLECEALAAMYPADELSVDEEALCLLQSAVAAGDVSSTSLPELQLVIRPRIGEAGTATAAITATLPREYPASPARISLSFPELGEAAREGLLRELREAASRAASEDQECLAEIVQLVVERGADLPQLLQRELHAQGHAPLDGSQGTDEPGATISCGRRVIWFHHIKSLQKRKTILALAHEARLHGVSKPGFPGILLLEGCDALLDGVVGEIRSLRWQAMDLRYEARAIGGPAACTLPYPLVELPESGMGELSRICDGADAAWRDIFRTSVLKLKSSSAQPEAAAEASGAAAESGRGGERRRGATGGGHAPGGAAAVPPPPKTVLPAWCSELHGGSSRLSVRVRPGARSTCLLTEREDVATADQLAAELHAAPRDGEANAELVVLFAKLLGVSKSSVSVLAHSAKSRDKELRVGALAPSEAVERILAAL